ncbi:MAG: sulfatase [Phycisphaerales bacterium]|nr:sulfatase [Phycisphaerales bacterium]
MNERRPNILIVVFDAARAENFSIYGYERPTTPNLQRHARHMAIYRQCISCAMWTMASTAGLFTGTYPSTHRLEVDGERLSRRFTTLAELLSSHNYATAKITGHVPYVSDFSGLDRGFAHNFEPPPNALRARWRALKRRRAQSQGQQRHEGVDLGLDLKTEADEVQRRSMRNRLRYWMTGFADAGAAACFDELRRFWSEKEDRPRFAYLHLQETHAEYRPPHRYRRKFLPSALRNRNLAAINQRPNPHDVGLVKMTQEDYDVLTALYDSCIAYLDEQVGRLLDDLSKRSDFDNTLVIVTADHGDCLGRHGILGHQFVCYDELIHIPWIVKWPRNVAITGPQDDLIQNVDLVPTVCSLLGLERPAACEGIDVLSQSREAAISELLKPFGLSALRQGLHEMAPQFNRGVLSVRSKTHKMLTYTGDQADEAYDLEHDPRESHNLLPDPQNAATSGLQRLQSLLNDWKPRWLDAYTDVQSRLTGGSSSEISPEVEERLRALGYLD